MDLTPSQIAKLEQVLRAGFGFITLQRYERYFGVARDGFAVLIDPAEGRLRLFGQVGYLMGEGLGMLVERGSDKAFVWHDQSIPATTDLLTTYEHFRAEVENLLKEE